MIKTQESRSILKTIDRALALLLAFTKEKSEWGVTELSKKFGWEKSVTQRMLSTLELKNFVYQLEHNKKYRLGSAIMTLSNVYISTTNIFETSREYMHKLADETKETILLTIPEKTESICLEVIESTSPVRVSTNVGSRGPLHAGAASKVLFAFKSDEELSDLLNNYNFHEFTNNTITDKQSLIEEFREIRENGIAISFEEMDQGTCAIAVPIKNHKHEIIAGIAIVGPKERVSQNLSVLKSKLLKIGQDISIKLGAQNS